MRTRFVVGSGEETTVGAFLEAHGADARAVAEGRVFVDKRRAGNPEQPLRAGDELVVEAAREPRPGAAILSEYEGLYAAWKPPGLSTEPDRSGTASLVHAVAELIGASPTELHAATRLDAPVSGIVVIARGSPAARRVAALQASGAVTRYYVAIAMCAPDPAAGEWDTPIGRGARGQPSLSGRDARDARTRYAVTATATPLASETRPALLVAMPLTGRTHQIRLHAAGAGAPLLGDAQHGGPRRVVMRDGRAVPVERVALHAGRIEVAGRDGPAWRVTAPPPPDLDALWAVLGGDPGALGCALDHGAEAFARAPFTHR